MQAIEKKIREILTRPRLAVLATVTAEGLPWCRYVIATPTADYTIRFASFLSSRKVEHIRRRNTVHLTLGVDSLKHMGNYLQIAGTATVLSDHETRHGYWKDQLKQYFSGPDDPDYCVVEIQPQTIEHVSMEGTETLVIAE